MNTLDRTVGELARDIPGATAVFHAHNLNFCCGGKQTLRQALADRQMQAQAIAAEIDQLHDLAVPADQAMQNLSDIGLIEHILSRYHDIHRQQLPELFRLAARVELVHGGHPQCPAGLAHHLETMQQALEEHMRKEEQILFPMIARGMRTAAVRPVAVMRQDHDDHGEQIVVIMHMTHNLALPEGACNTWQALYSGLEALCRDLKDHIHLENNVLFNRIDGQPNLP